MNEGLKKWFDSNQDEVIELSKKMFDCPEVAMTEFSAAKNTTEYMKKNGFEVKELDILKRGGEPNCIVATYGSGKPVIGILGEFDALPSLGQNPVPEYSPIEGPGHGCGHHLMGAGAAASAVALKNVMDDEKLGGTVVYYGCPAEEVLSGKVYMAREGLFDNLDMCVTWHPLGKAPSILEGIPQANINLYFTFHGRTAHAAGSPEDGRSALDACELMNVGVNYLREHVTTDVRMHYSYISAGDKPNIVPDYAKLHYFIRAGNSETCETVMERVLKCAEGAATMTETTFEWELDSACKETLPNPTLNEFMLDAMKKVPEIEYSAEDQEFAKTIYKNFKNQEPKIELLPVEVPELTRNYATFGGSTDVGDVSHIVPTVQIFGGGVVNTLPQHSWTTTATTGSPIGYKSMIFAAKCMAQCVYDALKEPSVIDKMWEDFHEARKDMKPYKPGLPD